MEELFNNPERFRAGKNYKASNIVYKVNFEGEDFIVKKPRLISPIINGLYALEDLLFYGPTHWQSPKALIKAEAERLETLDGCGAPKLVYHMMIIL